MAKGEDEEAPEGARRIASIIKSMGVERYERGVIEQLLNHVHNHIASTLNAARAANDHAGKSVLDSEDLQIGAQVLRERPIAPPSASDTASAARYRNCMPLPNAVPNFPTPPDASLTSLRGKHVEMEEKSQLITEHRPPWAVNEEDKARYRAIQAKLMESVKNVKKSNDDGKVAEKEDAQKKESSENQEEQMENADKMVVEKAETGEPE